MFRGGCSGKQRPLGSAKYDAQQHPRTALPPKEPWLRDLEERHTRILTLLQNQGKSFYSLGSHISPHHISPSFPAPLSLLLPHRCCPLFSSFLSHPLFPRCCLKSSREQSRDTPRAQSRAQGPLQAPPQSFPCRPPWGQRVWPLMAAPALPLSIPFSAGGKLCSAALSSSWDTPRLCPAPQHWAASPDHLQTTNS